MNKFAGASQAVSLYCHAASSSAAIDDLRVTVQRLSASLQLQYRLSGKLGNLRIPSLVNAERRDELWRHTCAELFVAEPGSDAYMEFNLSPSTCWAAYEFSGYRQAMHAPDCDAPMIAVKQVESVLMIDVHIALPPKFAAIETLQASVTMVVEDSAGQYAYWAVQHATATPDFHCRQSFVLNV